MRKSDMLIRELKIEVMAIKKTLSEDSMHYSALSVLLGQLLLCVERLVEENRLEQRSGK